MGSRNSLLDLLARGGWFSRLPECLQSKIVERLVQRTYARGQAIYRSDERPKGLFVVMEGRVRLVCRINDSEESLVYVGDSGFWFAEFPLLSGAPALGDAVAATRVRTMLLPTVDFDAIVAEDPRHYRAFADLAFERYKLFYRYIAQGPGLSAGQWLRTRLTDWAALRRSETSTTGPVTIFVSQEELARVAGVSRPTLQKLLRQLEAEGFLETAFRRIRVLH